METLPFFEYMMKMGCNQKEARSLLHHVMDKQECSRKALEAILFDLDEDRTRRQKLIDVNQVVDAHRRDKMKAYIEQHKLTMWRRENGFDLQPVVLGKLPPPTRAEDNACLRFQVQELRNALSAYASNPVPPQDVCTISKDEDREVRMDLGLEQEPKPSPSTDPDSETTGQRSTPQGGIWEPGLRIADGSMLVDMRSKAEEDKTPHQQNMENSSPEHVCTQVGKVPDETNVTSEESKTYDPGGQEEDLLPCKSSLYKSSFFLIWGEQAAWCYLCSVFSYVFGFSVFSQIHFFQQVTIFQAKLKAKTNKALMCATGGQAFFSPIALMKMIKGKHFPV